MKRNEEFKDVTIVDEYPVEGSAGEESADMSESEVFKTPSRNNKGKVRLVVACIFFAIALVVNVVAGMFTGSIIHSFVVGPDDFGEAIGIIFMIIFAVAFDVAALIASILSIVFSLLALKHSKVTALVLLIIISVLLAVNIVLFIIMISSGNTSGSESTAMAVGALFA